MTDLVERFDGRQAIISGAVHTVIGKLKDRPAILLRDGEQRSAEISVDDFRRLTG